MRSATRSGRAEEFRPIRTLSTSAITQITNDERGTRLARRLGKRADFDESRGVSSRSVARGSPGDARTYRRLRRRARVLRIVRPVFRLGLGIAFASQKRVELGRLRGVEELGARSGGGPAAGFLPVQHAHPARMHVARRDGRAERSGERVVAPRTTDRLKFVGFDVPRKIAGDKSRSLRLIAHWHPVKNKSEILLPAARTRFAASSKRFAPSRHLTSSATGDRPGCAFSECRGSRERSDARCRFLHDAIVARARAASRREDVGGRTAVRRVRQIRRARPRPAARPRPRQRPGPRRRDGAYRTAAADGFADERGDDGHRVARDELAVHPAVARPGERGEPARAAGSARARAGRGGRAERRARETRRVDGPIRGDARVAAEGFATPSREETDDARRRGRRKEETRKDHSFFARGRVVENQHGVRSNHARARV